MKKRVVVMKRSGLTEWTNCSYSLYSSATIWYGECRKNQAENIRGHAVDGCREFMASGENGTDRAFTCAACGCHRKFHRKYVD